MNAYECLVCGTDNTPDHCMGAADSDRYDEFGEPSYRCSEVVCVCGCEECNPQNCRQCGHSLWDYGEAADNVPLSEQEGWPSERDPVATKAGCGDPHCERCDGCCDAVEAPK